MKCSKTNISSNWHFFFQTTKQTTSTFVDAWQVPDSRCENEIPNDQEMELVCTDEIKSAANQTCNTLLSNDKFSECLAVNIIQFQVQFAVWNCYAQWLTQFFSFRLWKEKQFWKHAFQTIAIARMKIAKNALAMESLCSPKNAFSKESI